MPKISGKKDDVRCGIVELVIVQGFGLWIFLGD